MLAPVVYLVVSVTCGNRPTGPTTRSNTPVRMTSLRILSLLFLVLAYPSPGAQAAEKLYVGGAITDLQSGACVSGADVVVFNRDGEVVASTVTDENGEYVLPADWDDCSLKAPPGGKGLLSAAFGLITWPVRMVTRAVGVPASAVLKTAARAAGGAAGGAASAAAVAGTGGVAAAAATSAGSLVGKIATEMVVGDPEDDLEKARKDTAAAQVRVRVWKKGYRDYSGMTGVYLLDRIQNKENADVFSLAAVDAVLLAGADSETKSRAPRTLGVFTRVTVEPAITPPGSTVRVFANIAVPPEALEGTRMVGRDLSSGAQFELRPSREGEWTGVLEIPVNGPYRDHDIVLAAYRSPEAAFRRDKRVEDRAADLGVWDLKRPYPADPAFLVSRNRGHAVVTVTRPSAD